MARVPMLLLCALLASPAVLAQPYPAKPVRLIVPNPPGGAQDVIARATGQRLGEQLGQPFIIDNRPGAGGTISAAAAAKEAPDGYTLLFIPIGHYTVQHYFRSLPYDPVRDFTPVANLGLIPNAIVVGTGVPAASMKELLEYGRKNPGRLQYGTYAVGSNNHLAGILVSQLTGVAMEHVPYKGGAAAITDLVAGQLPMAIVGATSALAQARSGKLRMIALIETRRFPSVPGVPSVAETVEGYVIPDSWIGVLGPAGMARPLVERLNGEMRKAVHAPEVKQRLEKSGFEVTGSQSAEEFAAQIRTDTAILNRLIGSAGVKPE